MATCSTLTPDQIYSYAVGAGFPCDVAAQMVAIALKESQGQTCAHNPVPPDDSYGLWQVNMFKGTWKNQAVDLLTPRLAQFGIATPAALYDPATNAAAAYAIWGGNPNNLNVGWAINDGGLNQARYLANLSAGQAAAAAAGCSSVPDASGVSSDASSAPLTADDLSSVAFSPIDLSSIGLGSVPLWYLLIPAALLIGAAAFK